jgi:outer membrane protein assembly factor BamB
MNMPNERTLAMRGRIGSGPGVRMLLGMIAGASCAVAGAGDWPQILGPDRTGVAAADERLADRWPEAGPPVRWRREVGAGYAGLAVVGDRGVLFHRRGDREIVEAIDVATGRSLWTADDPTTFRPQVGGGDGPLCVPLIDAGSVFTFGAQGTLACRDLATGKTLWSRRTHREFGAAEGYFGAGSTPLVVGDLVIVNVGGRQDAGIVAFDRRSGDTVWQRTAEAASYSAPVAVAIAGRPHVLAVTRSACLLLEAAEGRVCWQFPFGKRGPTVNAATPVILPDGRLFVTAAYGVGGVCAEFDATAVRPLWQGEEPLATQYCTPLLVAGHLLGIDGRDDVPPADLVCADPRTGRVLWRERDFGYGTLLAADGKLLAAQTDGDLQLLRATPAGVEVLGRCRPLPGTLRALPALSRGRLYLRDDATLICLDLAPAP